MNTSYAHQQLCDQILIAIGGLKQIRVWPRKVGFAVPIGRNRPVRFGIQGETDIQGIIAPTGRMLAIEVKTGTGRLTKDQERFRDMIVKFGGLYIEARSVEDVTRAVQEELSRLGS